MPHPHKQPLSHPFRRHIPTRTENEDDYWFEIKPASFSSNRGGSKGGTHGGNGQ